MKQVNPYQELRTCNELSTRKNRDIPNVDFISLYEVEKMLDNNYVSRILVFHFNIHFIWIWN